MMDDARAGPAASQLSSLPPQWEITHARVTMNLSMILAILIEC